MNNINVKLEAFLPQFTPSKRSGTQKEAENARNANTDTFAPSEQAKKALGPTQNDVDRLREMMENSEKNAEEQAKGFEDFAKCMKIAARIMNGDIVPTKDHKFLAEKYPDIYERAILMRRINPEPKKYKSLIKDEEEETEETSGEAESAGSVSSGDTAVCAAAESADVEADVSE